MLCQSEMFRPCPDASGRDLGLEQGWENVHGGYRQKPSASGPTVLPPITSPRFQIRLQRAQIRPHLGKNRPCCAQIGSVGPKLLPRAPTPRAPTNHTHQVDNNRVDSTSVSTRFLSTSFRTSAQTFQHTHTHANAPWLTCAMESVVCNDAIATVPSPRSPHRRHPTTVGGGSLGTSARLPRPLSLSVSISSLDPCWCKHTCRRLAVPLPHQSLRHRRMRLQPAASSLLFILQGISKGYL
jgi:hypothetical protein